MNKGIAVQCQCCGTTSEITEMVAHDVFGFTLAQVQHILHDYREQVPYAEAVARRMVAGNEARIILLAALRRVQTQFHKRQALHRWTDIELLALKSDIDLILEQFKGDPKQGESNGATVQ